MASLKLLYELYVNYEIKEGRSQTLPNFTEFRASVYHLLTLDAEAGKI